jgi:hypothetical protein
MCYDILCGDVTCEYVCFITAGVTVCVYVSDSLSKIDRVCVFMCVTGTVCLLLQDRVCVYYCRTYYKAVRGGGRRRVEDICYERRRAEACVDKSAHHALGPVRNPVL